MVFNNARKTFEIFSLAFLISFARFVPMEHRKLKKPIELPTSKKYRYKFDTMAVDEIVSVPCKKNERDRIFHACRTRCRQVSIDGKKFKAYADDHSVYYKREA